MEEAKNNVLALIKKAAESDHAAGASRFAEAAAHAAHALLPLDTIFGRDIARDDAPAHNNQLQQPEIPPHVQRMLGESADLVERKQKLGFFIHGANTVFDGLPKEDQDLLRQQFEAMDNYSNILQMRLERELVKLPIASAGDAQSEQSASTNPAAPAPADINDCAPAKVVATDHAA